MEEPKSIGRKTLFQNDFFEIVSIEWTDQRISALHNHGWSQCLVLVEEGVFENHLDLGVKHETRTLNPGDVLSTPVGAQHEMVCKAKTGKTLHVYTPKIKAHKERGTFQSPNLESLLPSLALSSPASHEELLKMIDIFQAASITTSSPFFMNQLFSGVLPQMLMAEQLVAQTKTTLATFEASPVFSTMESEVIMSLCRLIGWEPDTRCGVSVPGGSAANFMAVHCARQKLRPEIKSMGIGGERFKVFVSKEAHYSFKKACAVLGLGTASLVAVSVDENGRMQTKELEERIKESKRAGETPLMVAATAGTTVLGSFDEIGALASVCRTHGVWLHIDGAWGGPALFSKKLRHWVEGIELSDSMTFDAHKLFGASLTTSFFLTRHPEILLEANDVSGGEYLFHETESLDRGRLSWQCGRKADATSFWMIWKSIGTEGLGAFVDRLVDLREEILPWIKSQSRLELVTEPDYLNVCVRILPPLGRIDPSWSKKTRATMKEKDQAFVNYSTDASGSFLRLILAHPDLRFDHVRQILEWALAVE